MRKKLLLTAVGALCTLGIATVASAEFVQWNMEPWAEWGRTYQETSTGSGVYQPTNLNPNTGTGAELGLPTANTQNLTVGIYSGTDNSEDSWGVASVNTIYDALYNTIWSRTPQQELTMMYYGGDDVAITTNGQLLTTNFRVEVYLDSPSDFNAGLGVAGRTAVDYYNNATDGTLVLTLEGHNLWYDFDGTGNETQPFQLSTGTFLTTGIPTGTMFLDVVTGDGMGIWQDFYNTNFFDLENPNAWLTGQELTNYVQLGYGAADMRLSASLQPSRPGVTWNLFGTGEVQANAVPEPATMLLFGTGLAGLAGMTRRRRKTQE